MLERRRGEGGVIEIFFKKLLTDCRWGVSEFISVTEMVDVYITKAGGEIVVVTWLPDDGGQDQGPPSHSAPQTIK